jgi:hypothetical protein
VHPTSHSHAGPNETLPQADEARRRRTPSVGDRVHIIYLAAWQAGTVVAVHDNGRRIQVHGEEDQATREFVLSRTTAQFTAGGAHGPRLRWARQGDV